MPTLGPINRRDLIRYMRQLGFDGPFPGGNHEYMVRGQRWLIIPNPHSGDISRGLLSLQGVYAKADSEECKAELQSVLEDWMLYRIAKHLSLPAVDGIDLNLK